jgi:hypothetical protein
MLWLFVFVVGSLIVTFLVSPNSFQNFKSNINNIIVPLTSNVIKNNSYTPLIPSQMSEYNPGGDSQYMSQYLHNLFACSSLEASGQMSGISDAKAIQCEEACGKRNMNYRYYSCDKDVLTCYCSS